MISELHRTPDLDGATLLVQPPSPSLHPPVPPLGSSFEPHMGKEKERSRIDIILDAPYVSLCGTSGTTVDPAVLSGHVSLYLAEDMDIREVSLHFRGKAKVPVPTTESLIHNSSAQSYIFCSHDLSFLESSCNSSSTIPSGKRSLPLARTLKAGRHVFPFTFSLTGNLPSTLTTHSLDLNTAFPTTTRASITYKLRAVASRPGLSLGSGPFHNVHITPMALHNLTCTVPVYVLRSLSPEALEYQLSLEMENTWPEKLMYSIMLPHKAWAAGDILVAVLKLCPLAKGVWVENVVTTLLETTQLLIQQDHHLKNALHLPRGDKPRVVHDVTRIVRCVKHKIVNGKAVRVDLITPASATWSGGSNTPAGSALRPGSVMDHPPSGIIDGAFPSDPTLSEEESQVTDEENHDTVTYLTFPIPHLSTGPYSSTQTATPVSPRSGSAASAHTSTPQSPPPSPPFTFPSYSYSPTPLPTPSGSSTTPPSFSQSPSATVNPTHNLSPIIVSHRIRWSFSIHNRDGHVSELRCSLPLHVLDGRVLSEAREASVLTRRMALAAEGLWRGEEDEEDLGLGGGGSAGGGELHESGVDRELPSYMAHVRDRVANMYYPEMATVRVPWVDVGGEGSATDNLNWNDGDVEGGFAQLHSPSRPHHSLHYQTGSGSASGGQSLPRHLAVPDEPHQHHHRPRVPSASSSSSPHDWVDSEVETPLSSLERAQNASEVAESSTRIETHSRSWSPQGNPAGGFGLSTTSNEHARRSRRHSFRNLSNLLKTTMKPFTTLGHHHGNGGHGLFCFSKSSSLHDDDDVPGPSSRRVSRMRRASIPPTLLTSFPTTPSSPTPESRSHPSQPPLSASSIISHSISEVPNYFVASQGFMGGVPPLSSLMDLPSYEEAATDHHNVEERLSTSRNQGDISNTDPLPVSAAPLLNVDGRIDVPQSISVERPPAIQT